MLQAARVGSRVVRNTQLSQQRALIFKSFAATDLGLQKVGYKLSFLKKSTKFGKKPRSKSDRKAPRPRKLIDDAQEEN